LTERRRSDAAGITQQGFAQHIERTTELERQRCRYAGVARIHV
jgi:hypothetical protein